MHYSVTTYRIDPARCREAFAFSDSKREEMKSIAGLIRIHVCDTDVNGREMIIVGYYSRHLDLVGAIEKIS